jgi:hypothetical protein
VKRQARGEKYCAAELGAKIQAEDGLENAKAFIEEYVENGALFGSVK